MGSAATSIRTMAERTEGWICGGEGGWAEAAGATMMRARPSRGSAGRAARRGEDAGRPGGGVGGLARCGRVQVVRRSSVGITG